MQNNSGENMPNTQAQAQEQQPAGKGKKRKKTVGQEIREWVVALAVAVIIVTVIQSFAFRIISVDGSSMETTLHSGERLFVTVADVRFGDVSRGTPVICHYPNRYTYLSELIEKVTGVRIQIFGIHWKTFFVKRVVAVPGDTLYCENGVTHVVYEQDGVTVDEALDENCPYPNNFRDDYEAYTLGEDEYFVVGDNRGNSHDSRDWDANGAGLPGGNDMDSTDNVGPISKSMIVGRVRQVITPLGSIRPVK